MIIGFGTDIQVISDIEESLAEHGDNWLTVILTEREIEHLKANSKTVDSVAGRIAAKEAAMKALELLPSDDVDWLNFEIVNAESGKPELFINGSPKEKLDRLGATDIWLSISHSGDYAIAQVIIEVRCNNLNR